MTYLRHHSSRPDDWTLPRRPVTDAERHYWHGPVKPMERRTIWERIFR